MKFQPRRRVGIFLMAVSVVFLIGTLYTLFFYTTEAIFVEPPIPLSDTSREQFVQPQYAEGPPLPSPSTYTWPYRWLSQPLAIIGILLFLSGLLVGYHDDISQIF